MKCGALFCPVNSQLFLKDVSELPIADGPAQFEDITDREDGTEFSGSYCCLKILEKYSEVSGSVPFITRQVCCTWEEYAENIRALNGFDPIRCDVKKGDDVAV